MKRIIQFKLEDNSAAYFEINDDESGYTWVSRNDSEIAEEAKDRFADAIARINRELGTLTAVITHNASISSMADRVVYLSDGRIAEIKTNNTKARATELVW